MENDLLISGKYFILSATAALLMSSAPVSDRTLMPSNNCAIDHVETVKKYPWEQLTANPYYDFTGTHSEDIQNMITVEKFASTLLENMQDLDPLIANKVNEEFWNLI